MAPALSSNSFLLSTTPSSRLTTLRNPRLAVSAKRAGPSPPFRFGKPADDSSAEESPTDDKPSSNPFSFNFGKVSDVKALIPVVASPSTGLSFGSLRRKDPGTVFVAGATGLAGVRITQTLLREGFTVRAGVADLGAAQELARIAAQYKIISNEESKSLNAVESTFQDAESIAKAIGNASKVVVTIGPDENGPAAEVTTSDAAQVIQAAQFAGVGHVAIIYDEAATFSTYNVLDGISSFFSNLFSRSQPLTVPELLQKVVEAGDVSYTLIKTRLTEDFSPESSYNVVVSAEGSVGANDYKVAKSQIALLVAKVFANTAVAANKVVQVCTNPAAPSKTVDELFSAIPEDGRRKAYAESLAKAEAEEEARKATERALEAANVAKRIQTEVKKLEEQEARAANLAEEAQVKAEAAGASVEGLLDKAKEIGSGLSWEKFSSQIATAVQKPTEKPKVQIATVRGQAKAQTLRAKKAVIKPPTPKQKQPPKPKETKTESQPETRKIFGGLFQQETIYVDD
ncbi:protein PLASTID TRANSCRIPTIONALLY ACTIVE 16, chloroplastic [Rhododendron vialii]|uniref:protein PLASTID TRANSCRIPTIONALLY ACTIVE 16, chloroplastic n=1 Tax=Rhododendron vialii TaxID=182163 RepID=UPI00265FC81E|nr:protein PLASTID TRANSCRIPTIONALLY ACTIVE 16, chloroplastic [Rhododendron vialii]